MERRGSLVVSLELLVVAGMVAALAFAGAGDAKTAVVTRVKLALMPLPRDAIRSQVAGLPLNHDSGVLTNSDAADNANEDVKAKRFAALGRITGYGLDFGEDAPSGGRVFAVATTVELYSSPAAATRGLAFWKNDDGDASMLPTGSSVDVEIDPFTVSGFDAPTFADAGVVRIKGAPPFYGGDLGFRSGTLVGLVEVGGASLSVVRSLLVEDARALETRMNDVLAGRISGRPVPLPGKQQAGPVPGGPDLKALALTPADLGTGKITKQGYQLDDDLSPLSEYARSMSPAGSFATLQDQVALYQTPRAAEYECAVLGAFLGSKRGIQTSGMLNGNAFRLVPVSLSLGDQSTAVIVHDLDPSGTNVDLAFIVVRVGRTLDFIVAGTRATFPVTPASVVKVAKSAAARLRG